MRRLVVTSSIVAIVALVMVVAPTVTTSTSASAPPVQMQRVPLSATAQREGWAASANVAADMVGVKWTGDASTRFEVSTRDRNGRWSQPTPLDVVDTGPDPGTREAAHADAHATEPVWVRGSEAVRVTQVAGTGGKVDLEAFDAPAPKLPANAASAAIAWPGIILRGQWGADESLRTRNCSAAPQYSDRVRFAVIHHTVESNDYSPSDSFAIVRSIYAYSVLTLGYCDMMYNFLVDKYGQIFEGRYGGTDKPVLGAHAIGFNNESVGVAAIGDYSNVTPSPALIDAIERLLAWKFAVSGIDPRAPVDYVTSGNDKFPAGTHLTIPTVVGHRDTWFTSCPGNGLYQQLGGIWQNVAQRIELEPMDVFSGFVPPAGQPKTMALSAYGGLYPAGGVPGFTPPAWWPGWKIARSVALLPSGRGGYVLDGWGVLHSFGAAPNVTVSAYWPGWDIARDVVLLPSGNGGYVLDGWGGLHPFGAAPPVIVSAYWRGWDIARRVALLPSGTGGYVLDGWGGVHPFGTAPPVHISGYWKGWDIAREIAFQPGTSNGYVLDGFGGIWPLNGAPPLSAPYFGRDVAVGFGLVGTGGYVATSSGGLYAFGGAPPLAKPYAVVAPPYVRQLAVVP